VNNDPVNWIDPWGLSDTELTIYNTDPTPEKDEIISSSGNYGHTWLSVGQEYRGWGWQSGDPITDGSLEGAILDTESDNLFSGPPTSTYKKTITDEQANAILEYFNNAENSRTKYNLGGSFRDPNALNCTEAVQEALNYANALTPEESDIINSRYSPWGSSYPDNIPSDYDQLAPDVKEITAPNPNSFDPRNKQLDNINNNVINKTNNKGR
jgi:hypothetical protein